MSEKIWAIFAEESVGEFFNSWKETGVFFLKKKSAIIQLIEKSPPLEHAL